MEPKETDELESLRARVAALEGLLRDMEWGSDDAGYCKRCFFCGHSQEHGHDANCHYLTIRALSGEGGSR